MKQASSESVGIPSGNILMRFIAMYSRIILPHYVTTRTILNILVDADNAKQMATCRKRLHMEKYERKFS